MDGLDHISVRFHFGGAAVSSYGQLQYVGGRREMSYIEVDKVSLPEIKGHLADYVVPPTDVMCMHWLMPGKNLSSGLMLLVDDGSCQVMANHIINGGVADVFVEGVNVVRNLGEMKHISGQITKQKVSRVERAVRTKALLF
jgi:alpha-galactosidase